MNTADFRKPYREAWNKLFGLVKMRNARLQRLNIMVAPALSITLASGTIYQFDTDLARELLVQIDELTPLIEAGIDEVNRYADRTDSPRVRWKSLPANWSG